MSKATESVKAYLDHCDSEGHEPDLYEIVVRATRTNEIIKQARQDGELDKGPTEARIKLSRAVCDLIALYYTEAPVDAQEHALASAYERLVILAEVMGFDLCHCEQGVEA